MHQQSMQQTGRGRPADLKSACCPAWTLRKTSGGYCRFEACITCPTRCTGIQVINATTDSQVHSHFQYRVFQQRSLPVSSVPAPVPPLPAVPLVPCAAVPSIPRDPAALPPLAVPAAAAPLALAVPPLAVPPLAAPLALLRSRRVEALVRALAPAALQRLARVLVDTACVAAPCQRKRPCNVCAVAPLTLPASVRKDACLWLHAERTWCNTDCY